MAKKLNLNRSVYELTQQYPELTDVLARLGFSEITKTAMLHSVGRMTTLPKGARMKGIPMGQVISALMANGFELEGDMPTPHIPDSPAPAAPAPAGEGRTRQLKGYLRRLGTGEALETVRADFVREFAQVDAAEIMKAEQELLREGTPLAQVQRLCDVHSALFHGATREEQIANAEKAVEESLKKQSAPAAPDYGDKKQKAAALAALPGHPLHLMALENEALAALIGNVRRALAQGEVPAPLLDELRQISIHYAKKGDLLYPHLKVRYGISGPSDVMWTVDDEIRDEIAALSRADNRDSAWRARLGNVLQRAEEMIYKEKNIFFPICAVHFTAEDWYGVYQDAKDYAPCFQVTGDPWPEAEGRGNRPDGQPTGEIILPGGHMTLPQLTALLNTLPLEITFVDADNINRFFNEGPKVFKRPGMAIDREVFSCHPPKIEPMVRSIIEDFRAGRRDSVPVWMEKGGRTMLVTYMAVRNEQQDYLGTVELVQDMEFAKAHFAGQ